MTGEVASAPTIAGAPQATKRSTIPRGPSLAASAAGIAVAVVLYARAHEVARWLDEVLPAAATVKSAGTQFPGLRDAFGFQLRGLVLVAVAVAVVAFVASRPSAVTWRLPPTTAWLALAVLVLGAAALYGYLGYPHNGFPSNSRIHWVDIHFDRADSFHYTLPKLPHRLFYDAPYLLQALNAAVNVVLAYLIGTTLLPRRWLALVMAATLVGSSLMLSFGDTAEDVQLNVAALLFAALAYARRWTPWLGVSLVLVVLGRPQLVLVAVAVVVAEVLVAGEGTPRSIGSRLRAVLANRFLVTNLAVALGLFLAWHAYLVSRGDNWFLHGGKLIDAPFTRVTPRDIEGFVISRLSGAYLLHALWIFPVGYVVANAIVAGSFRQLPLASRRFAVFAWVIVAGGIVASELQPLAYFNVRYLTYLWPFVLIAAWLGLDAPLTKRVGVALPVVALALSALTPYWQFRDTRERVTRQPVAGAFGDRGELRGLVGNAPVATTFELPGVRNYLAYLFKRPVDEIAEVEPGDVPPSGFVVALASDEVPGEVVYREGQLVVVMAE